MSKQSEETFSVDFSDPEIQWIFSQLTFRTAPIAHDLRKGGQNIPRRIEEEQLAAFRWMLGLYVTHGVNWKAEGDKALTLMRVNSHLSELSKGEVKG